MPRSRSRPANAEALNNRSVALVAPRPAQEALESSERALAGSPDYADAHYNRGNALRGLARFEEARASYAAALATRAAPCRCAQQSWAGAGRSRPAAEALANFDPRSRSTPTHLGALHNRANALAELARFDEALAPVRDGSERKIPRTSTRSIPAASPAKLAALTKLWRATTRRWRPRPIASTSRSIAAPL